MSRLSLFLLGPPRIEIEGVPVEINRKKAVALIVYLALTDKSHSRDTLSTLLWPEYDQSRARAALRRILSALNKAIGSSWLNVDRETVSLNRSGGFWTDVDGFQDLLDRCEAHGHSSEEVCPDCVKLFTESVKLYKGDFLEGFSLADSVDFDDWQFSETQNLRSKIGGVLERLVSWHEDKSEFELAIGHAQRWLKMDRTDEAAHLHLMDSYARTGQHAAALRQYEECVRILERELKKSPREATVQLYEDIKENLELVPKLPPLKSPDIPLGEPSDLKAREVTHNEVQGRSLPTGTVTILFTDIEDSTKLIHHLGDLYKDVLSEYRRMLRDAFQEGGGYEIDSQGEGFFIAFQRARDSLVAAVAAQREIVSHSWPEGASVRVAIGLHTGEPALTEGGYVGLDVHRTASICSAAHGGQILLSQTTYDLVEHGLPEGVSLSDLGKHRLKDLQHPERIFQLTHPDLHTDFPPLNSLDILPTNLPIQLTSFIGREAEIAEVKRLLSLSRLLTLTGSGGCGKTRLALQVAADLLKEFSDGVWLVELASLSDHASLPQVLASALGVSEQRGRPLMTTISDYLQSKHILLVLDNCEHLIEACATLADGLLKVCPRLQILATSQEVMGIAGETACRVPSLSLPNPEHLGSLEASDLKRYESVLLFIDRAVAALPDFTVTERNAPLVTHICQRLDGIPLAIELAAARVKALGVEDIANLLDDRFRLLTSGSRTALPRQQTLRAAMDWSYDLLGEAEQMLLSRLSAFAGGWTLAAAEAVARDAEMDILDLTMRLVDKSLVVVEESERGDGVEETRYHLLETIRHYGWEKLKEAGVESELGKRHGDWFLALAERAELEIRGPNQVMWLDRLEREHDNLRAALEWSNGEEGDSEVTLRLAGALWWFWYVRGYFSEGFGWLGESLSEEKISAAEDKASSRDDDASSEVGATTLVRARVLYRAGSLAWYQGDYERAQSLCEESLDLLRQLEDKGGIASSLIILGLVTASQGDYERAVAMCEESLSLLRELGDKWSIASALFILGEVLVRYQEDFERTTDLCQESLGLFRELGDRWGIANALRVLAVVVGYQGDYGRAMELCGESLSLLRELGDKGGGIANSLRILGRVAYYQGDYARALELYKESLILLRELGDKAGIAECLEGLVGVAVAGEKPERAAKLSGAAEALRQAIGALPMPSDRAEYDRSVAKAGSQLGNERYQAAWAEGKAMTLEQAIEYALTIG